MHKAGILQILVLPIDFATVRNPKVPLVLTPPRSRLDCNIVWTYLNAKEILERSYGIFLTVSLCTSHLPTVALSLTNACWREVGQDNSGAPYCVVYMIDDR